MAPKNCSLHNITSTSLTVQCPLTITSSSSSSLNNSGVYLKKHYSKINDYNDDDEHHLSAKNSNYYYNYNYNYILLIYNGLNHKLIRNLTQTPTSSSSSSAMIRFDVNNLSVDDMDNLNIFIYAVNQMGGQSERILVPATNLVGQPKKLGKNFQNLKKNPIFLSLVSWSL